MTLVTIRVFLCKSDLYLLLCRFTSLVWLYWLFHHPRQTASSIWLSPWDRRQPKLSSRQSLHLKISSRLHWHDCYQGLIQVYQHQICAYCIRIVRNKLQNLGHLWKALLSSLLRNPLIPLPCKFSLSLLYRRDSCICSSMLWLSVGQTWRPHSCSNYIFGKDFQFLTNLRRSLIGNAWD